MQGPTWGYPTEGAYYRDASCCDSLLAVRTPLFAIHAEDDPVYSTPTYPPDSSLTCEQIAAIEAVPLQEFGNNPFAVLCTTSRGGHLGWFENGGGRWFLRPVRAFISLRWRPY